MERVFNAGVAELVDALDLGSSGKSRVGSSPIARTKIKQPTFGAGCFYLYGVY